jgi:hypothetical protein
MDILLRGEFGTVVWTLTPEGAEAMKKLPPAVIEMATGDIQRYLGRRVSKINKMLQAGDVALLGGTATSEE